MSSMSAVEKPGYKPSDIEEHGFVVALITDVELGTSARMNLHPRHVSAISVDRRSSRHGPQHRIGVIGGRFVIEVDTGERRR